jgi:hypothetical protein
MPAAVDEPSVKGTLFKLAVDDLRRLIDSGAVSRDLAEQQLGPGDLDLLDALITPSGWYPVDRFNRLRSLVHQIEGNGEPAYIRAQGARMVERLLTGGPYQGLIDASRARPALIADAIPSIGGLLFNFCQVRFEGDPRGSFAIEFEGATCLADDARWSAEGLVESLFPQLTGRPIRVTSERPSPDRFILRGVLVS